jgi:pyruvate dehydrogenase E1 component
METAMAMETTQAREARHLACLRELERKVLWLACWTIHNANHIRPKRDGLKVGGHQASSASVATILSALYFDVLGPADRVAVKPHASPVYHAIQYLYGRQSRENLERFRALGGAQSYPSRTKDADDVDFSTGSVGLGVAVTAFASMVQDYLMLRGKVERPGRMVAIVGDAELDEGNIFECLLEGWKHELRNTWWVIDYNRQSLDAVINDAAFEGMEATFESMGWKVHTLKYGTRLEAAFERRGGDALRAWIDGAPNSLYSALVYKGGGAWREHILRGLGDTSGIRELLDEHDDNDLAALMTNLAGNDMPSLLDAFHGVGDDERPQCFIAYTIKGFGLPFAGHKDNHAGLMNPEQMQSFRETMHIGEGREWEPFEGLDIDADELRAFLESTPLAHPGQRRHQAAKVAVPARLAVPRGETASTQEGFGRLLADLARSDEELADRIVTTSPDVTVSTNLGAWVNRRGIFHRRRREDTFHDEEIVSAQRWTMSPEGQHLELGIAENNLFLALGALGMAHSLFGHRLLPVGTVYDPFIARGLDALNYACYQDARFLLVGTPSGISLAPEGGAHQSVSSPLIGMGQPGLACYEPAYNDELAVLLRHAFDYLQRDDGGSVYLRLSTRSLEQPEREIDEALERDILAGAYWWAEPAADADIVFVASGVLVDEARKALDVVREDVPGAGLLVVTSADRLHAEWLGAQRSRAAGRPVRSHVERLLGRVASQARLVTAIDGHPATLSWVGAVARHRTASIGVERFGQSGDVPDLYRAYGLDCEAMIAAAAAACLDR